MQVAVLQSGIIAVRNRYDKNEERKNKLINSHKSFSLLLLDLSVEGMV